MLGPVAGAQKPQRQIYPDPHRGLRPVQDRIGAAGVFAVDAAGFASFSRTGPR